MTLKDILKLPDETKQRLQKAYNFFKNKGLPDHIILGILGNLYKESLFKPDIYEKNNLDKNDYSKSVGLAQWRLDRRKKLEEFAKQQKKDWKDFDVQLEYIWHELTTTEKNAYNALLKAKDVKEAAYIFNKKYERSSDNSDDRYKFALNIKDALGISLDNPPNPNKYDTVKSEDVGNIKEASIRKQKNEEEKKVVSKKDEPMFISFDNVDDINSADTPDDAMYKIENTIKPAFSDFDDTGIFTKMEAWNQVDKALID